MVRYKIDELNEHWLVFEWNELRPEESKWDVPTDSRLQYLFDTEAEAQAAIDEIVG